MSTKARICLWAAWSVSMAVTAIAIITWGRDNNWHFGSIYQIFPVLGLTAFSIMLSHYVAAAMRRVMEVDKSVLKQYFRLTSLAVLVLICLHPALLIYQRYRDGYGFPPHSYETYVAPGLGWVTLLGSVCFFIFIGFEFHRKFGNRSWWKYVGFASDAAMLGIFYHGLKIGDQIQQGWFHKMWLIYGVILVSCLAYSYSIRYFQYRETAQV